MLRKRLNCPDIVTFWSADTGQWILGYWISRRAGLVDEVEDLGPAFEAVTPPLVEMIAACWKPVNWKEKKKRLMSRERDRIRKRNDQIMEDSERWNWAKGRLSDRGINPVPYMLDSRMTGGGPE